MKITYDILQNLLKCNKGMKLVFRDNKKYYWKSKFPVIFDL